MDALYTFQDICTAFLPLTLIIGFGLVVWHEISGSTPKVRCGRKRRPFVAPQHRR